MKIGLRHVLSWPKIGLEPQCHEAGTFGGFGKRQQTHKIQEYRYRYILNIKGKLAELVHEISQYFISNFKWLSHIHSL